MSDANHESRLGGVGIDGARGGDYRAVPDKLVGKTIAEANLQNLPGTLCSSTFARAHRVHVLPPHTASMRCNNNGTPAACLLSTFPP